MLFKIQTRIADDRLELSVRDLSISHIIDAIDVLLSLAIRCNSAINSGSSDMLVWCPDKDTDIFFIIFYHPLNNQIMHDMDRRIFLIQHRSHCFAYKMFQMNQM